jgi:ubiquinone/menaquinone biosynthesis C-methylase UbiE
VGSIPEKYDRHLGPLFFEHYAADLAGRVAVPADRRILEIACGTGISTRYLRAAVADGVAITATDLNQAMLDYARGGRGPEPRRSGAPAPIPRERKMP